MKAERALYLGADALVFIRGKDDEDAATYSKSAAIQVVMLHSRAFCSAVVAVLIFALSLVPQFWIFGYELPDTQLVVTHDTIYCLGSQKKIAFLEPLKQVCRFIHIRNLSIQVFLSLSHLPLFLSFIFLSLTIATNWACTVWGG